MPSILWSIEGLSGQVKGVKLPATVQLQDPDAYHPPPPTQLISVSKPFLGLQGQYIA